MYTKTEKITYSYTHYGDSTNFIYDHSYFIDTYLLPSPKLDYVEQIPDIISFHPCTFIYASLTDRGSLFKKANVTTISLLLLKM